MNAPFPSGDLPGYSPSMGYEAPIYDEHGSKHEPYTEKWYEVLQRCADTVFGKGRGRVRP